MPTYYVEAFVPARNALMADTGLTADQVERLREAERNGTIRDLIVTEDVNMTRAFSAPAMFHRGKDN